MTPQRRSPLLRVVVLQLCLAVAADAAGSGGAQLTKAGAAGIIRKVERMSVADLDPSLPRQPLDSWLKRIFGPGASVEWEISDCDLKPSAPEPSMGYPLCVTARAGEPRHVGVKLHILVGAYKRGVFGRPEVHSQSFMSCSSPNGPATGMDFRGLRRLSEIPKNLEALRASDKCR
jgi:hypothetical protein